MRDKEAVPATVATTPIRSVVLVPAMLLLALLIMLSAGCSSSAGVVSKIPETMHEACALYEKTRPQILSMRAWAAANWDRIPEEVKSTLIELDGVLPELDHAGKTVCAISHGIRLTGNAKSDSGNERSVDWDQILSIVVKAAGTAIELKAQGVL